MIRRLVLVALVAMSVTAQAQTEQERAQARAAFQAGVEAYAAERFEEALRSFQEAYRIAPHPAVRVNMANCYEQLDRPVEAIFHFERFLVEAEEISPEQRREVRQALRRLRARVGELFLRVEPEGASVTIDGTDTRRAPILDAVRLPAGPHEIEVRMDGFRTVVRRVNVQGGERSEVRVSLQPGSEPEPLAADVSGDAADASGDAADVSGDGTPTLDASEDAAAASGSADAAISPETPAPGSGRNYFNTPALITGAATLAIGVTALAMGLSAVRQNNRFDDAVRDSNDPSLSARERNEARQRGLDAKDKADRRALTADILGFTALAAAGATAYFMFFYDDGSEDRATSLVPALGPEGAGLIVRGSF